MRGKLSEQRLRGRKSLRVELLVGAAVLEGPKVHILCVCGIGARVIKNVGLQNGQEHKWPSASSYGLRTPHGSVRGAGGTSCTAGIVLGANPALSQCGALLHRHLLVCPVGWWVNALTV